MAKVHINDVRVCENPSPFSSNFQFQITFECTEELNEGLLRAICFDYPLECPSCIAFYYLIVSNSLC